MAKSQTDKKLMELDGQITSIAGVIEETEKRRDAVQGSLSEAAAEIPRVMEQLKVAMVEGLDLVELDSRRKTLVDQRDRDTLLLRGLNEKLEALEIQLSEAITARNERFSDLAAAWLRKEGQGYNKSVKELKTSLQRLFGMYRILQDLGLQDCFSDTIGGGWRYLAQTKLIPTGNGFNLSDMSTDAQQQAMRPSPELLESLFGEVTTT